jgi:2-dehydro-3-deoxygalactonokinase
MPHPASISGPAGSPVRATCVGIDWGASRRRVYLLAADGTPLACHEDGEGLLAARGRVLAALDGVLGRLGVDPGLPVLISGLHGTAHGVRDIPSLGLDVPLMSLARHLVRLEGRRFAVPEYAQTLPHADLMRGQATQLVGLVAGGRGSGWTVLPGTHSRWVYLRKGRVVRWHTFVTGELFESQRHLGASAPLLEALWSSDPDGFDLGLDLAQRGLPVSQALFSVRASVLTGAVAPEKAAPMLSGLLIGAEFHAMTRAVARERTLRLVAADPLRALYERAAAAFGWTAEMLDAHALYGAAVRHLVLAGHC